MKSEQLSESLKVVKAAILNNLITTSSQMLFEALTKKGHIYGLRSQAASIVASLSKTSFVLVEGVTPEEVATMKATIQALKDQIQQKDQKWQELQDELQQKDQKWQESLQDQLQKRDQEWEQRFPSMMEKYWQQKFAGLMLGPMQTRPSQQGALQLPPTLEDNHDNDSDGVDSDEQIVVDIDGVDFDGV